MVSNLTMLVDISPFRKYPDYRLIYFGQFISAFGSMMTYVALPYQVYELTKDSFLVGLLGGVQLVPVIVFGLYGGDLADRMDRKKLLLFSELLLCLGTLGLAVNAMMPAPSVALIFVLAAFLQAMNALHRPAMEALTQYLIESKDYSAVAGLNSVRSSFSSIAGPALGGVLIAAFGMKTVYLVDFFTFFAALIAVWLIQPAPPPKKEGSRGSTVQTVAEGLRYAYGKPVLMGTYIVDIVAMTFAFPVALFPAMAEPWGGPKAAGILFSSMAVGSLMISVTSGWTNKIRRHGAAVVIAAALWGVAIIAVGFSPNVWVAAFFLALAGAADSVSAIFRFVIWNDTIPNEMRGRLAGVEMISYMSGPLLGNARSGWMAGWSSVPISVGVGGVLCVLGIVACGFSLPAFWRYEKS